MFTVDQFQTASSNVGYQPSTFVKDFLIKDLHLDLSTMRNYSGMKEYDDALSRGSKSGGVDAIYGEIPYMKLFVYRYGSKYKMAGPLCRLHGSFSSKILYFSLIEKSLKSCGRMYILIDFYNFDSGISCRQSTGQSLFQGNTKCN